METKSTNYVIMFHDETIDTWKVRVKNKKYSDDKKSSYSSKFDPNHILIYTDLDDAKTARFFIKSRSKYITNENQLCIKPLKEAENYFKDGHFTDWCIIKINSDRTISFYSKNCKFENNILTNEIMFYPNESDAVSNANGNLCVKYNDL